METTFEREVFPTSSAMEFFAERELTRRIGFGPSEWPISILGQKIDNGLDACERLPPAGSGEARRPPPQIEVVVDQDSFSVRDNGPGLPWKTLKGALDFGVRVSDKTHYVGPSRGQQGNALKTALTAPFVVNGDVGFVDVEVNGERRTVEVRLDEIAQEPVISLTDAIASPVERGTLIRSHWPGVADALVTDGGSWADYFSSDETFSAFAMPLAAASLVRAYATFNPHATFTLRGCGKAAMRILATDPLWQKWSPSYNTSAFWYTVTDLCGLVAAYLNVERQGGPSLTIREFITKFCGLTRPEKGRAVAKKAGLHRKRLTDLLNENRVDAEAVGRLLDAMQKLSRPVKPEALGVLGKCHIGRCLAEHYHAAPASIMYKQRLGFAGHLPYVLEVAFGFRTKQFERGGRRAIVGVNFSPALLLPFVELDNLLDDTKCGYNDQIVILCHVTCPSLPSSDFAKARVTLPEEIARDMEVCLKFVTKNFVKEKKKADELSDRQKEEIRKPSKPKPGAIRRAAFAMMPAAYAKASEGAGMATARQVMYPCRQMVLDAGLPCWKNSDYFSQTLIQNYMRANVEKTKDWDVTYDDRGRFYEPHTGRSVGLGTLSVRKYIGGCQGRPGDWKPVSLSHLFPTLGPAGRYRYALFLEKEGFGPLLAKFNIAQEFDLALLSTKGMSVTACRKLVEYLSLQGVICFVLHDFDKSGLSIIHTLKNDTTRFKFSAQPNVIDIGLRLADIQWVEREMGLTLPDEDVVYKFKVDPRDGLRSCGATEEECDFLVHKKDGPKKWVGKRVELNAFPALRFVEYLRSQLRKHGAGKFIPTDPGDFERAYRHAHRVLHIERAIQAAEQTLPDPPPMPADLAQRVRDMTVGSLLSWDEILWRLVSEA